MRRSTAQIFIKSARCVLFFIFVCSATLSQVLAVPPPASPVAGKTRMMHLEQIPYLAPEVRTHEFTSYKRIAEWADFNSWLFETNGERVMLSAKGPGCVTRLWVTGVNDSKSLLKFYFNGETNASFSATPQELFRSGTWPYPVVAGLDQSAGGRICYIPIPFETSLMITDAGASKIPYYNITCERYAQDTVLESWNPAEDYADLAAYLSQTGHDPKPDSGNVSTSVSCAIDSGMDLVLLDLAGSGVVQSIELDMTPATREVLSQCTISMVFDGQTTVTDVPLGEFFGSAVGEVEFTSLPMGMRTNGSWYCYFPMPYWDSVKMRIHNGSDVVVSNLTATVMTNSLEQYDRAKAGYFCASRHSRSFSTSDGDMVLFDESGTAGKFVGLSLYMEGDGRGTGGMMYLEGDARIYIDHSESPAVHGTGNEDWFNAAYYYNDYSDKGAAQESELFSMPYHGLPAKHHYDAPNNWTQAYRFNLADPIEFSSAMLFTMEAGAYPWFTEGYYSAVGYSYQRLAPLACPETEFYTGSNSVSFAYSSDGAAVTNTSRFITPYAEMSAPVHTFSGFTNVLHSSFTVDIPPANRGVIFQSLSDYSVGTNSVVVSINGTEVGGWNQVDLNFTNSVFGWGINELLLPASSTAGTNRLEISMAYSAPATEYRFRIIPLAEKSVGDSMFSAWGAGFPIAEGATGALDDPDGDGQANLMEYAEGGSPVDVADRGGVLRAERVSDAGSTNCSVVYARRMDYSQRELFYTLEQCTNLISGGWMPVSSLSEDTGVLGRGFEWVTNRLGENDAATGFFRVRVGLGR